MNGLSPWKRNEVSRNANGSSQILPVSHMRMDWDRLFDRFLDDVWSPSSGSSSGMALDVTENDEMVRVRAEVPGINPNDLNISLTGEMLTLSGEKLDENDSQDGRSYYSERQFGSFQRVIKLPCPVDADKVEAEHKNGVVTIKLRKSDAVRPKRIKVKSA